MLHNDDIDDAVVSLLLTEKFFPNSSVGDLWVDDCESLDPFPRVTLHEIKIALKAMLPLSVPGHDGFPAIVFKEASARLRKVIQNLVQLVIGVLK
jgi:hypothetical protein